jgi:cytochrome c556
MKQPSLICLLVSIFLLAGCGGGGHDNESDEGGEGGRNALMSPGEDCTACHSNFSVAGTVFPAAGSATGAGVVNATVVVIDANNQSTSLTTNAAGNFYTTNRLAMPLKQTFVIYNGVKTNMLSTPMGACSSCHTLPPKGNAPGRLHAN